MNGFAALTILYAEDDRLVAELVCEFLSDRGHDVHHFPDGASALAAAEGGLEFDILLTDVTMPVLDGASLATYLRCGRRDLPVVVMTGVADHELSERLRRMPGAPATILSKPLPMGSVIAAVEAAGSGRAAPYASQLMLSLVA